MSFREHSMTMKRQIITIVILLILIVYIAIMGYTREGDEGERTGGAGSERAGVRGMLHKGVRTTEAAAVTPSPEEQTKKEIAERLDTAGLLYTGKVVVDRDARMLEPSDEIAQFAGEEYIVAQEPPEIEFCIIPVEPLFLAESPVKVSKDVSNYKGPWKLEEITNVPGPWTHFSQGNYDSRTGKFYTSVGNHGKYNARIFIVEYDPVLKKVTCLPEINSVIGRTKTQFSEGKIHGWLDFYKSRDFEREHLWYCTYWSKYPEPDEEDYATGYRGGHIISHDVLTGDIVDYGVPMMRASYPYHRVDTRRGIMYAVGMFGEFLAWDINEQKTKWAGYLPGGMAWWNRAIMIDEETGMVYTTNMHESDTEKHFIKYDPYKNRFFKLNCHVPQESSYAIRGDGEGSYGHMRAQTRHRGPDGLFWCTTYGGQLFTFDPEKEEVVDRGVCWPHEQRYTAAMDRSPGGRYVYYVPCSPRFYYTAASPVIQYDTHTGMRKVLAFMYPFYREKYGFTASQAFSVKLDDKGETLFIVWNGGFIEQVAIMLVHIPESERVE